MAFSACLCVLPKQMNSNGEVLPGVAKALWGNRLWQQPKAQRGSQEREFVADVAYKALLILCVNEKRLCNAYIRA